MKLKDVLREHREIHNKWIKEEPSFSLFTQHEELVMELGKLGWKHKSPLDFQEISQPRLIFLGTKGFIEESSKEHHYHTNILLLVDGKRILIDHGEISPPLDTIKPDIIILSHCHPDHVGIRRREDKRLVSKGLVDMNIGIPVFMSKETDKRMKPQRFPFLNRIVVDYFKPTSIDKITLTFIPALHSSLCPMSCILLEHADGWSIFVATDMLSIRERVRKKYLQNIVLWIGDASAFGLGRALFRISKEGEKIGHAAITTQLNYCKELNIKHFILTHWGKFALPLSNEKRNQIINNLRQKYPGIQIEPAFDGSEFGLVVGESIVEIGNWRKYDPSKVDTKILLDDHRIACFIWPLWFKRNPNKKFESPQFKDLTRKEQLKVISKMCQAIRKELAKRGIQFKKEPPKVVEVEKKKLPGLILKEPHARLLWEGKKLLIVKSTRGMKALLPYVDKPMILIGEKAYGILILSEPLGPFNGEAVLKGLQQAHLISQKEWRRWWGKPRVVYLFTVNWVQKWKIPKDFEKKKGPQIVYKEVTLKEKVEDEIKRLVDTSEWDKLKVPEREKLMDQRTYLEAPYPFSPTKTAKKGYRYLELFDKPSVILLAKDWFREHPGATIYTEVKFDGMRMIGAKKGKTVYIWSEGGERLDDVLPHLREDLLKIKADSVLLDAETVPYDPEREIALGRRAAVKAIGKKPVDDSSWIAWVFDILYLNGEDLHKKPYEERRKILRGLELPRADFPKFPIKWHWFENIPRIAHNPEETVKYVKEVSDVPFSEGAMLKLSTSIYPITKRTPLWAKFKKFFDIDVMVLHAFPKIAKKKQIIKGKPIKPGDWIPGQNRYACVIGPVQPPKGVKVYDLKEVWKEFRSMENYKAWKAHKIQYIRYKGRIFSNIGITMSTAEPAKIGDIIRCTVRLIRKINPTEYRWLIARFLEPRPEKREPDPISTAAAIAKASQYRIKEWGLGYIKEAQVYLFVEEFFEDLDEEEQEELREEDPAMMIPDEEKTWKYVLQCHVRGASAHL